MRFAEDEATSRHRIRAYGPGEVRVDDEILRASLVVMPDRLIRDWAPQRPQDITEQQLTALLEYDPEILILGTGTRLVFPPARLMAAITSRGIGLEVMDTASACRTYNILMAEERRVVAALLMIEGEE